MTMDEIKNAAALNAYPLAAELAACERKAFVKGWDAAMAASQEAWVQEWREGYVEQQRALEAMHEALLTIWRSTDPQGRQYLTYQEADEVAREALVRIRTVKAEAWDEGFGIGHYTGVLREDRPDNPYRDVS